MPQESDLAFVIPFKSAVAANDWQMTQRLLVATLRSIRAQSDPNHQTIIVCNERPHLPFTDDRIHFVEADTQITLPVDKVSARDDLKRKRFWGLRAAAQLPDPPERVMFLDADDLVHRDLVKHIRSTDPGIAQIIRKGFRYIIGDRHLRWSIDFHNITASSMCFPLELDRFDGVTSSDDHTTYFMTETQHVKPVERVFRQHNIPFEYVPFTACIYIRGAMESLREQHTERPDGPPDVPARKAAFSLKRYRNVFWKVIGRSAGNVAIKEQHLRDFNGLDVYVPSELQQAA